MQLISRLGKTVLIPCTLLMAIFFFGCNEDRLDVNATGVLDGTILDFTSELNLGGAILTTNPPTVSVASDSAGYFIFKTIEVGDYNLIARKNGYVSESVSLSVQKDKTTTVVILMERSSEYNDPPVFSGSYTPGIEQINQPVDLTFSWTVEDLIESNLKSVESCFLTSQEKKGLIKSYGAAVESFRSRNGL